MKHLLPLLLISTLAASAAVAEDDNPRVAEGDNPRVVLKTSKGKIVVELLAKEAPGTVKNFLGYVESGFYNGTIFHRVMPDFMIQCGGFTPDLKKKDTRKPIQNEADNGLSNERGTLAMARTGNPHSATAQFFINVGNDNGYLDHTGKDPRGWGYAVFGKVVEGMEVVDAIAAMETTRKGSQQNLPVETVTIVSASKVETGG
ncbi:MAG: peptidyl-prolyl cis-trans isomerase [bacterium]|nr:peptidyl-prolyl cis-trans isomerase [bacterium]